MKKKKKKMIEEYYDLLDENASGASGRLNIPSSSLL
jgi:hypothetical protein